MTQLLTKREAAQHARISERPLDRLIAARQGPQVTRIGSRVLFREDQFGGMAESAHARRPSMTYEFAIGLLLFRSRGKEVRSEERIVLTP